jgi:hypothetical protein
MLAAINRFKVYSCFMSDEALVRLMTSLVTSSLNSLGAISVIHSPSSSALAVDGGSNINISNGGGPGKCQKNRAPSLLYMQEGINQGAVANFSLEAVIEITKLNSCRASCIWQMVTSHLRMLASMRNKGMRFIAVAATLDIVKCALGNLNSTKGRLRDGGRYDLVAV